MNNKILLLGICIAILSCIKCQSGSHILGNNFESINKSIYTGRTTIIDDRLFVVGDIVDIVAARDSVLDYNKDKDSKMLVRLTISVRSVYVHCRILRYITRSPCIFQLAALEKLKDDTITVNFHTQNTTYLNQIDKRNCLIGLDIPFYMNTKALVDGELSNGANSSLVAPFSTYYLDSLVLYDSVFTAWKNQCLK